MSIDSKKYSVLIVDDEETNIMVLTYILESTYEVIAAKNGKGAINAARMYLPDVILLDIIMPDMDGYEVITELKNSETTMDIPVIFVTGMRDIESQEKGFELGAADYIIKPFSTNAVETKVKNQIKQRKMQCEK